MKYILNNIVLTKEGEYISSGFYGGCEGHYSRIFIDAFSMVPRECAYKFENLDDAEHLARRLNSVGYRFIVEQEYGNDTSAVPAQLSKLIAKRAGLLDEAEQVSRDICGLCKHYGLDPYQHPELFGDASLYSDTCEVTKRAMVIVRNFFLSRFLDRYSKKHK